MLQPGAPPGHTPRPPKLRQEPAFENGPVGPGAPASTRTPSDGLTGNGIGAGQGNAWNVLSVSRVTDSGSAT